MPARTYTLEEIKVAFWAQFDGAGELWFSPEQPEAEDAWTQVECEWNEFVEKLENPEVHNGCRTTGSLPNVARIEGDTAEGTRGKG